MSGQSKDRKKGSGRPPGATSFTHITLRELRNLFDNEDSIKVSRVWLEKYGLGRAIGLCKELNLSPDNDTQLPLEGWSGKIPMKESEKPISFVDVAKCRNYRIRRPSPAQRQRHIDFVMSGLNPRKRTQSVTIDIKYRHKKASDKWHWVEFRNPQGKAGWLYQEADFIVFERNADFIIVNRKNLVDWVNINSKIRHDLPFVKDSWAAKYRLYRRPRKNETITQIQTDDLLDIEGTHIWSKNI